MPTGFAPVAERIPHWTDSLLLAAEYEAADVDLVGADDTITAYQIESSIRQYELLKMANMASSRR